MSPTPVAPAVSEPTIDQLLTWLIHDAWEGGGAARMRHKRGEREREDFYEAAIKERCEQIRARFAAALPRTPDTPVPLSAPDLTEWERLAREIIGIHAISFSARTKAQWDQQDALYDEWYATFGFDQGGPERLLGLIDAARRQQQNTAEGETENPLTAFAGSTARTTTQGG